MTQFHLTLLRYGRSRADDEGVHEGRYDSPLSAQGQTQARALAAYWQAHPPGFDRLYCSTLARAHDAQAWLLAVGVAQVRVQDAARETARAAARGDDAGAAVAVGRRVSPAGSSISLRSSRERVVATVVAPMPGPDILLRLPGVRLRAEAVALAEESP